MDCAGRATWCAVLIGALLSLGVKSQADTIYVDSQASGTTQDGTSWCAAFTDLQSALNIADVGDTVRVAGGTYKPSNGVGRRATFQLLFGVNLEGGFSGCDTGDPDERDIPAHETILSGDIGVEGDETDNVYHVVTAMSVNATSVLDGFTITGGYALGPAFDDLRGAGMFNRGGSPTVSQCTFTDNSSLLKYCHFQPAFRFRGALKPRQYAAYFETEDSANSI